MEPGEPIDRVPRVHLELGVPRYVWVAVALVCAALVFFLVTVADQYAATQRRLRDESDYRARRDTLALDAALDTILRR